MALGESEYLDYTAFQHHRTRVWKLSDGIHLTQFGGLDVPALGAAGAAGVVVAAPLLVTLGLLGIPSTAPTALAFMAVGIWFYQRMTNEKIKKTPLDLLRSWMIERWQPSRYAVGIGADFAPTDMNWQVVLWRPEWATVRLGPLRRWTSYAPEPVSMANRRAIDVTGIDEAIGWNTPRYERTIG